MCFSFLFCTLYTFISWTATSAVSEAALLPPSDVIIDVIPLEVQYPNGSSVVLEFVFREQLNPFEQVEDFCQTYNLHAMSCVFLHERVREYQVLDMVTITVKRTGATHSSTFHNVVFTLYAGVSLTPRQQVAAFCRTHGITDDRCAPLRDRAQQFAETTDDETVEGNMATNTNVGTYRLDRPAPPSSSSSGAAPTRFLALPRIKQLHSHFKPSAAYLQRHSEVAHLEKMLREVESAVGPSQYPYDIRRLLTLLDWREYMKCGSPFFPYPVL